MGVEVAAAINTKADIKAHIDNPRQLSNKSEDLVLFGVYKAFKRPKLEALMRSFAEDSLRGAAGADSGPPSTSPWATTAPVLTSPPFASVKLEHPPIRPSSLIPEFS
jgi:hypothetical protein